MLEVRLTLPVAPVTKKNHGNIVRFGRNKEHVRVMPSEQYQAFFRQVMSLKPRILRELGGVTLPITAPVQVSAQFYRERNIGDLNGFMQALGDVLQSPVIRDGKLARDGLGIIKDDSQIDSWDGTRRRKDAANPRIEIEIRVLGEAQERLELGEEIETRGGGRT